MATASASKGAAKALVPPVEKSRKRQRKSSETAAYVYTLLSITPLLRSPIVRAMSLQVAAQVPLVLKGSKKHSFCRPSCERAGRS